MNQSFQTMRFLIFFACLLIWLSTLADLFKIFKKKSSPSASFLFLLPFLLLIFIFFYSSLPFKSRTKLPQNQSLGNLHTHTLCSDGQNTYEEMVNTSLKLGFTFLAFTDHRFPKPLSATLPQETSTKPNQRYNDSVCQEIFARCPQEKRLLCLLGEEVTGRVHILGIGLQKEIPFPSPGSQPGDDIKKVVAEIHRQGGLAIAAHPFEKKALITEKELAQSGFDAMECDRDSFTNNQLQKQWSKKYGIPCLWNSDAHEKGMLRYVYNVCNHPIQTLADLKMAIQNQECRRFRPLDAAIANLPDLLP